MYCGAYEILAQFCCKNYAIIHNQSFGIFASMYGFLCLKSFHSPCLTHCCPNTLLRYVASLVKFLGSFMPTLSSFGGSLAVSLTLNNYIIIGRFYLVNDLIMKGLSVAALRIFEMVYERYLELR